MSMYQDLYLKRKALEVTSMSLTNISTREAPQFQEILDKHMFHHEYYFISQLFDDQWVLPTATIASVQS